MSDPLFRELRGFLDGNDSFMTGHQVIKMRQGNRETPIWATSNKRIQEILLHSFPKLKSSSDQRAGAARWALFIQLYFRHHMTRKQTAEQMGISLITAQSLARNIRRAAAGKWTNGKKPGGKRGRPKKSATYRTAMGRQ